MKNYIVNYFVVTFLIIGCASSGSSSKKSSVTQRAIETKEYQTDVKTLMQSTIGAFQDLGYTIETLNKEFGLITASKIEEPVVKEDDKLSAGEILLGIIAIGAILTFTDLDDDDSSCLFCRDDDDGETVVVKDYKLTATATIKSINDNEPLLSSLRVNFGSSERKITLAFFKEFFSAVDKSLFLN